MKSLFYFVFLIFLLSALPTFASDKEVRLEEIVVTATKTERAIDEVPGRVEVITKEDIQKTAAQKVDDILANIAGISVIRGSGIYTMTATATLRGLSNEQARTLVLLDGIPLNKGDTGDINFNRINIDDIERIEIFKGPASSLYGNNAMGGVINIITKKPAKPFEGSVSGLIGSQKTFGGDFNLSGRMLDSSFFYRISGRYLDSDGYLSTPSDKRTAFTVKRFAEELTGSASIGYDFDKINSLTFKADYYNDKRGEGVKIKADDGVHRHFDTNAYMLKYHGGTGDIRWQAKGFYSLENYRRISERQSGTTYTRFDVDSDRKDIGVDFSVSIPIGMKNILTFGGDLRDGSVDAIDEYKTSPDKVINKGKLTLYGIWVQDELSLMDNKLQIIGSIRYDYARFHDGSFNSTIAPFSQLNGVIPSNNWSSLSPKISARYMFTKELSTYASYGRGFRASILDDLCRSGIMWGLYKEANPNLKPEKIDSFEMGMDYKPFEKLVISPSLYYSKGTDFLYYVPTGNSLAGRPLYRRENVGEVISYGAEIIGKYTVSDSLKLSLSYTYSHAEIESSPQSPSLEGAQLTRNPKHQIKGDLTWLNPSYVNINISPRYKSSQMVYTNEISQTTRKLGGYFTLDAKASRQITKNLSMSLSAQNIFDKKYTESADEMSPGIVITGLLKYTF